MCPGFILISERFHGLVSNDGPIASFVEQGFFMEMKFSLLFINEFFVILEELTSKFSSIYPAPLISLTSPSLAPPL